MKQKKEERDKQWNERETEDLVFAAQEQTLRKNWVSKSIDAQKVSEKCRMCGEGDK